MTDHILKKHKKNLLLYHIVFPAKYRRKVFTEQVEQTLMEICQGISDRYEIHFIEIGADENHVHFLVQSVPVKSPTGIVRVIKSITSREIFKSHPEVKEIVWGGHFWTSGYYITTVGSMGNEQLIREYVKKQGLSYKQIYLGQLSLFE
ncbi:MAG: IS200/IS605 family transposase [Candidatus Aminicenantes bacterium]|nr:IS200/IS605 family transposase [Candidatus Aminicenantes bacterium]